MTFGKKLKLIRTNMKLSQEEFANKLNTSKQVISRYEKEQTTPKITVVHQFSKILDIPLENLVDDSIDDVYKKETSSNQKDNEIVSLFNSLPKDEQKQCIDYIKFLIHSKGK